MLSCKGNFHFTCRVFLFSLAVQSATLVLCRPPSLLGSYTLLSLLTLCPSSLVTDLTVISEARITEGSIPSCHWIKRMSISSSLIHRLHDKVLRSPWRGHMMHTTATESSPAITSMQPRSLKCHETPDNSDIAPFPASLAPLDLWFCLSLLCPKHLPRKRVSLTICTCY